MGIYESDHPDVPTMKGLHLCHFVMSNCFRRAMARPAFGIVVAGYMP